jgi:PhnB protein
MEMQPYVNFAGACEEALGFYKTVFGGEITSLMRFGDMPGDEGRAMPPEHANLVMHASFEAPGVKFMASDGRPGTPRPAESHKITLSIGTSDVAQGDRLYASLAAGGETTMPLQDTFWGARFGTLTDKYGIDWMINAQK